MSRPPPTQPLRGDESVLPDDLPKIEIPLEDRLQHEAAVELSKPAKKRPRKEVVVDATTQRVMWRPPRPPRNSRDDGARDLVRDVSVGLAGGLAIGAIVYGAAAMLV